MREFVTGWRKFISFNRGEEATRCEELTSKNKQACEIAAAA